MSFKNNLCKFLCVLLFSIIFSLSANAQGRPRVVKPTESQPTNVTTSTETVKRTILSNPTTQPTQRPPLNQNIVVVGQTPPPQQPLVKNTVSSKPTNLPSNNLSSNKLVYGSALMSRLMQGIQSKYGLSYRYGATGPNRYDCSGFVWSVFNDAGIYFERGSAKTYWEEFEPVYGDDRFKFGTLVFFNRLGHVGIVADEKGFYQASSSKGITYSPFEGYWEKRIVGFRRVPVN